jgi:hypothetical protein
MALKINIPAEVIASQFKEFAAEVEINLKKSVEKLATITRAYIVEQASTKLTDKTRRIFADSVHAYSPVDGVHVIDLDPKANWIEDGIPKNTDMKTSEWLLKNPDGVSKKGYKYKVIPFNRGKGPTYNTAGEQALTNQVKGYLKKKDILYSPGEHAASNRSKLEFDANGKPKLGRLHSLNIPSDIPGKGNTPALHRVSIYQTLTKTGNVRRDIFTFRTVSSGPGSQGKWIHPGFDGQKFFEDAHKFAIKEWETSILPGLLERWK